MAKQQKKGTTYLDEEALDGIIPKGIETKEELDAVEFLNVLQGTKWLSKNLKKVSVLDEVTLKKVHKQMFGDVWTWAGKIRKRNLNLGVDFFNILVELKRLKDDVAFWVKNRSFNDVDIAIRLHHRLVWVHPFVNGNGRWGRAITDAWLLSKKQPAFSWGGSNLSIDKKARREYIGALNQADKFNFKALLEFATNH